MKLTTDTRSNDGYLADDITPGVRVALLAIRGYKLLISPYFRGSCRFLPSCADYAADAFRRHGLARGFWLTTRRLARCHPFCAAGHDPVPPTAAGPGCRRIGS